MEVRCQNCEQRIVVAGGQSNQKVTCPSCGASQLVLAAPAPKARSWFGRGAGPGGATLRRVFEPIPRPLAYLAGLVLTLLILAPFWLYLFRDRYEKHTYRLSDDTATLTVAPAPQTPPAAPVFGEARPAKTTLDEFLGVRLESSRDDLQQRFTLVLQNTQGMVPEIYEVRKTRNLEHMTAYFYNNVLKEVSMVLRERRAPPDAVQKELVDQFGEPNEVVDTKAPPAASPLGTGLLNLGVGQQADDLDSKLAAYPLRRDLAWFDDQNRIDCSIRYSSIDPSQCVSLLSIHMRTAAWLKTNQPLLNAVAPELPTNSQEQTTGPELPPTTQEQTAAPPPAQPPQHLFP